MEEFVAVLEEVLNEIGKCKVKFRCKSTGKGMEITVLKESSAVIITVKSDGTVNMSFAKDLIKNEMDTKHEYDYINSRVKETMTLRAYSALQIDDFKKDFRNI